MQIGSSVTTFEKHRRQGIARWERAEGSRLGLTLRMERSTPVSPAVTASAQTIAAPEGTSDEPEPRDHNPRPRFNEYARHLTLNLRDLRIQFNYISER
jgi:hypothetical protein